MESFLHRDFPHSPIRMALQQRQQHCKMESRVVNLCVWSEKQKERNVAQTQSCQIARRHIYFRLPLFFLCYVVHWCGGSNGVGGGGGGRGCGGVAFTCMKVCTSCASRVPSSIICNLRHSQLYSERVVPICASSRHKVLYCKTKVREKTNFRRKKKNIQKKIKLNRKGHVTFGKFHAFKQ